jgi:hypothetical protein
MAGNARAANWAAVVFAAAVQTFGAQHPLGKPFEEKQMTGSQRHFIAFFVALILLLTMSLAYMGAYWSFGVRGEFLEEIVVEFRAPWQATLFYPAMYLEEKCTGRSLRAGCQYPHGFVSWEIVPRKTELEFEDEDVRRVE